MRRPIRVLELFAGIGACSKALERLGIEHEIVDAVEIDKYAIASFNAIHGTSFEPQDITTWDKDVVVDLIMHGSPCQDFSIAGKNAGGDEDSGTRSSLLYETLRIVGKLKPKYVIWENVKNLLSKRHIHNWDEYAERMEEMGYTNYCQVLNAKDYGVPQNRERVFTVSILGDGDFMFPPRRPLAKRLKDLLEPEVDEKYYLSSDRLKKIKEWEERQKANGRGFRFESTDGNVVGRTVTTSGDRPSSTNYIRVIGKLDIKGQDQIKRVYDVNGLSPTLSTMQGGNRQPKVGVPKTSDSMDSVEYKTKNQRVIDTAEKSGFREGKTAYLDVYNNTPRPNITSTLNAGTDSHQNNIVAHNYRIRKLTPKECWRLMGFDDEDIEKAEKVNSNTQLYKQAGNSIVVNVLEAILKELL